MRWPATARTASPRRNIRPRRTSRAGILHFGVGNFHRAHQAVYLDDLFNAGRDHDWAIVGAGVFDGEKAGREKLRRAGLADHGGRAGRGPHAGPRHRRDDRLPRPGDAAAIVARLADPAIRIVSLTITEGGYFIDPATGRFNPGIPPSSPTPTNLDRAEDRVRPDPRRAEAPPRGRHRRPSPSCPATTSPTTARSPPIAGRPGAAGRRRTWRTGSTNNVAFPNGMVDRITPATTDRERRSARRRFGIEDAWPVFCEPFRQWVLEDKFPGRAAGAGRGRRPVRRRRRALRADEDPHPQRRPRGDRLSGRAARTSISSTRRWRSRWSAASSQSWSRRRSSRPCRRCPASISRTISG